MDDLPLIYQTHPLEDILKIIETKLEEVSPF